MKIYTYIALLVINPWFMPNKESNNKKSGQSIDNLSLKWNKVDLDLST